MSSRRIFLSYRREDTAPYARLLQFQLKERIPDAEVFADLDSVEPGPDADGSILQMTTSASKSQQRLSAACG